MTPFSDAPIDESTVRLKPVTTYGILMRGIAIAIALAAIADPAIVVSGAVRPRVAVVIQQPGSPTADRVRARLLDALGTSHEIVPHITSEVAAAIVIGDHYLDQPVPAPLLVATVTTPAGAPPDVRIVGLDAPRAIPSATTIRVDVDVEGRGVAGRSTDLTVSIKSLDVGRTSHRWSADRERWRASIDVVPVGDPPWVVRVGLAPFPGATAGGRTVADTVVDLRRDPLRVEIYEPRPSWATTFVRRALEADARFHVESVVSSSRGIAVRTPGAAALTDPRLDAIDVLVAGGIEQLSTADVRGLDRFMRDRGGAVALVPDVDIGAGPVRDLLPMGTSERLLEHPAKLSMASGAAPLEASELLLWSNLPSGSVPIATSADARRPVVVSMPHGLGRLLVSGAMDAWRFRASEDLAFDRFWQETIAGLALAAPAPIEVTVSPPVLRPFERAELSVRVRSSVGAIVRASVDGGTPIRLWPEPEAGLFRGMFIARGLPGRTSVDVAVSGARTQTIRRTLLVQEGVETRLSTLAPLSLLASSHRGINVTPDRVEDVERFVRSAVNASNAAAVRRPMRSTWWVVPFAVGLSAEWWMRRRRGLR